jgi:hypothetical protein
MNPVRVFMLLVLPMSSWFEPTSADNLISGVYYENGETVDVQPFSQSELQEIADGATALGGDGAGILDAVSNGNLTVGLLAPQPDMAGASDVDTIGVNASNMEGVAAIVKHEYEHVQNAQATGTTNDHDMQSSLSNPCGSADHAYLTAQSANDICSPCTADMSQDEKDALRGLFEDFSERAQSLMDEASFYGCPSPATPPASMLIPPCECLS